MADDEQQTEEPQEDAPKVRVKKAVALGGGVCLLIAVGALAATMAVPGQEEIPVYEGPFMAPLLSAEEGDVQVNLSGSDYRRYLTMELVCEYDAFDSAYYEARIADEHFRRSLKDTLIDLAGSKTITYLMSPATRKVFLQEVRDALEPLLFPVHVGETEKPTDADPASGLRPGYSLYKSTFRGPLHEHIVSVDNAGRTLRIDDGPPVPYEGDEEDLAVASVDGTIVYFDVTRLDPEFAGEVKLGVHGRVRRVLKERFLVQ